MRMLSNKDAKQFAKGSIDIELLSDEILSQHSLCFSTFEDAKATISTQKIEYCFDRISLCVYSHNLRPEDFSLLGKALTTKCEKKLIRENQKARLEYGALFHMMVLNGYCAGAKIVKETRPDFILENKHRKIGVEVTELTTPQDQVLYAISKQNFGKGKSIDEIKRDALKKHGLKANEYQYLSLGAANAVGRPMFDSAEQHKQYADEIIKKFKLYENSFSEYHKFIILCNGQNSMCLSSKYDSETILSLAKEKAPGIGGFILNILRQDDSGKCILDSFDI